MEESQSKLLLQGGGKFYTGAISPGKISWGSAMGIFTALPTPLTSASGKFHYTSLKDGENFPRKFPKKISPPENFPSLYGSDCRYSNVACTMKQQGAPKLADCCT